MRLGVQWNLNKVSPPYYPLKGQPPPPQRVYFPGLKLMGAVLDSILDSSDNHFQLCSYLKWLFACPGTQKKPVLSTSQH